MHYTAHHATLPNGTDILLDSAPHFQTVAISVSFRVGSIHETPDQAGISHLLEHLMFRGSASRTGDEIHQMIEMLGGEINACTDEDSTTYTAQVVKEDLPQALEIMADMLLSPNLAEEDIALEKQIIERENCRGCYQCSMRETFYEISYSDPGLHNPIIGHPETLESITRENLLTHHNRFYVGENLVISIAGDLSLDEVVSAVEQNFHALPRGEKARHPRFDFTPDQMHFSHTGDTATVRLSYDFSHFDEDQHRAARAFIDILGGHGQSLLMQELREKRGLVYGVWAGDYGVADNSFFNVDVNGELKKIREVAQVMAETMLSATQSLPDGLFDRHKRRILNGARAGLDDLTARAGWLQEQWVYHNRLFDWDAAQARYQALTEDQVKTAGAALLALEPTILTGGSNRHAPKFDQLRAWLRGQDANPKPRLIAAQ
ncbi:insulinase family protein [Tropicibacter sp. R15_0]|uniref:M16 family metallopeptidase n=1 Tax=Tropicibacter sp. R15_0 TaxID=2821101 RepID=UPI001ADA3CD2|nr:pitrilysin family protein [Tropicibacter sp. R15_0]MBO9467935.1 insulinase family protein [Tropicibacter sp. R15_0]